MASRQVYFRIHTKGYSSGWSSDDDRSAFKGGEPPSVPRAGMNTQTWPQWGLRRGYQRPAEPLSAPHQLQRGNQEGQYPAATGTNVEITNLSL